MKTEVVAWENFHLSFVAIAYIIVYEARKKREIEYGHLDGSCA